MLITVITTTFNRKELLIETIKSVQLSVKKPLDFEWEHIIYDDASTDGTREIFPHKDWKNVTYLRGDKNLGQSAGKNEAVKVAKGEFLFFIDSDDIMLQRTLHNFATEINLQKNKENLWLVADFLHVDDSLKYLQNRDYYAWKFKNREEMLRSIFAGEHYAQANSLFSKKLFQKVGGFDENVRMGEDIDLYIRFLLSGIEPQICPFISHLHRCHSANISGNMDLEKHQKSMREFADKYSPQIKKLGIAL